MLSPGGNRKWGLQGQTDRCLWLLRAELGGGALAQHTEGLWGDPYLPALSGLPSTVESSQNQGGQSHRTPGAAPSALFMAPLSENRGHPTSKATAEELKEGQSCLSQALHIGGEQNSRLTGNAYLLTATQEALNQ